jgi:hypothetical protein
LIDERKMDAYYKKYKTLIYDKFLSKISAQEPASKSKSKQTRRRRNKKGRRRATMRRK